MKQEEIAEESTLPGKRDLSYDYLSLLDTLIQDYFPHCGTPAYMTYFMCGHDQPHPTGFLDASSLCSLLAWNKSKEAAINSDLIKTFLRAKINSKFLGNFFYYLEQRSQTGN